MTPIKILQRRAIGGEVARQEIEIAIPIEVADIRAIGVKARQTAAEGPEQVSRNEVERSESGPNQHVRVFTRRAVVVVAAVGPWSTHPRVGRGTRGEQIEESVGVEIPDNGARDRLGGAIGRRYGNGPSRLECSVSIADQYIHVVVVRGNEVALPIAVEVARHEDPSG